MEDSIELPPKTAFENSSNFTKMNKMKIILLVLMLSAIALASVGCTGSQEIVEPSRDDFYVGEVQTHRISSGGENSTKD